MVVKKKGSMFTSSAQAYTCTVNCVGVMGAGIAKTFKQFYPYIYEPYRCKCKKGDIRPGVPFIICSESVNMNPYILMFPTKYHWRNPSEYEWIDKGLKLIIEVMDSKNLDSLALPYLGAGLGQLDKRRVEDMIFNELHKTTTKQIELWDF